MLAIALLAMACATEAEEADTDGASQLGLDLERVEIDEAMSSELVVLGDALLARAGEGAAGAGCRSTDLGDSWERVEVPQLDEDIELESIEIVDGVAFIKGFLPIEPPAALSTAATSMCSRAVMGWSGRAAVYPMSSQAGYRPST